MDPAFEAAIAEEGAFRTALADFARRIPVEHFVGEPTGQVRQVLAIGARAVAAAPPPVLLVCEQALVVIESCSRRLRAYWHVGQTTRIDYLDILALAEMDGDADEVDRSSPGTLKAWDGNAFFARPEAALFDASFTESLVTKLLELSFAADYPDLLDRSEFAARQVGPGAQRRVGAFLAALEPSALETCRRLGLPTVRAFNRFAHHEPRVARYRHEAACAIPAIGFLCTERNEFGIARIRAAIDSRQPLIPALARAFRVPRETIRFLGGKPLSELGLDEDCGARRTWLEQTRIVLCALAGIAPEHRPRTLPAWIAFYEILDAVSECDKLIDVALQQWLRNAGRRGMEATRDALVRRFGGLSVLCDCQSFLESVERMLEKQGAKESASTIVHHLTLDRGVPRLLECTQRWHSAVPREVARRLANLPSAAVQFVQPFDSPRELNGLALVFLDRYAALLDEGARMSHCVATLYESCRNGERFVFSLRSENGRPCATFDVSISARFGRPRVRMNEIRGRRNTSAPPQCEHAAARLLELWNKQLSERPEHFAPWLSRRGRCGDEASHADHERLLDAVKQDAAIEALGGWKKFREYLRLRLGFSMIEPNASDE